MYLAFLQTLAEVISDQKQLYLLFNDKSKTSTFSELVGLELGKLLIADTE